MAYHDCTVSGLHMWAKHLVENVGWIMMAHRYGAENKVSHTSQNHVVWPADEVSAISRNLFNAKVSGFIASVRLFKRKLSHRIRDDETKSGDLVNNPSDTQKDLLILEKEHLPLLEYVCTTLLEASGSDATITITRTDGKSLFGGKRGSKKSSKSSKSTKPKKASKGKKGSKKSV